MQHKNLLQQNQADASQRTSANNYKQDPLIQMQQQELQIKQQESQAKDTKNAG